MTYFFYDSNDKDLKLKSNILYLYLSTIGLHKSNGWKVKF